MFRIYFAQLLNKSKDKLLTHNSVLTFLYIIIILFLIIQNFKILISSEQGFSDFSGIKRILCNIFLYAGTQYFFLCLFFGSGFKSTPYFSSGCFFPVKKSQLLLFDSIFSLANIWTVVITITSTYALLSIPVDVAFFNNLMYIIWLLFYINTLSVIYLCIEKYFKIFNKCFLRFKRVQFFIPVIIIFIIVLLYLYSKQEVEKNFLLLNIQNPFRVFGAIATSIIMGEWSLKSIYNLIVSLAINGLFLIILRLSYSITLSENERFSMAGKGKRSLVKQQNFFQRFSSKWLFSSNYIYELFRISRSFSINSYFVFSLIVLYYMICQFAAKDIPPKHGAFIIILAPVIFCNVTDYVFLFDDKSLLANYFLPQNFKKKILSKHAVLFIYFVAVFLTGVLIFWIITNTLPQIRCLVLAFISGLYFFNYYNIFFTRQSLKNPRKVPFHTTLAFFSSFNNNSAKYFIDIIFILPVVIIAFKVSNLIVLYIFFTTISAASFYVYYHYLNIFVKLFWDEQESFFQVFWEA